MNDVRSKLVALRAELDALIARVDADAVATAAAPVITSMTVEEYAEHRRVSAYTVYRWVKAGMPHERLGGSRGKLLRIDVAKADAWHAAGGVAGAVERAARADARSE